MSTWAGSICDYPAAYKSAGSALIADNILGLGNSDLATVATAQAACYVGEATLSICDQIYATQCARGFQIADNMDATFGSTFTAFYASLPTNTHQMRMITG